MGDSLGNDGSGALALSGEAGGAHFGLEKRCQIASFRHLQGSYQEDAAKLVTMVYGGRVRDDSQKLKEEWFRLGVRKNFYSVRRVKQQTKSPLRGHTVSILGGFQYLPGQSPEQLGLTSEPTLFAAFKVALETS